MRRAIFSGVFVVFSGEERVGSSVDRGLELDAQPSGAERANPGGALAAAPTPIPETSVRDGRCGRAQQRFDAVRDFGERRLKRPVRSELGGRSGRRPAADRRRAQGGEGMPNFPFAVGLATFVRLVRVPRLDSLFAEPPFVERRFQCVQTRQCADERPRVDAWKKAVIRFGEPVAFRRGVLRPFAQRVRRAVLGTAVRRNCDGPASGSSRRSDLRQCRSRRLGRHPPIDRSRRCRRSRA